MSERAIRTAIPPGKQPRGIHVVVAGLKPHLRDLPRTARIGAHVHDAMLNVPSQLRTRARERVDAVTQGIADRVQTGFRVVADVTMDNRHVVHTASDDHVVMVNVEVADHRRCRVRYQLVRARQARDPRFTAPTNGHPWCVGHPWGTCA
eukprot:3432542-Prymnesium_polylepis.1